jgi:hypothetical protein
MFGLFFLHVSHFLVIDRLGSNRFFSVPLDSVSKIIAVGFALGSDLLVIDAQLHDIVFYSANSTHVHFLLRLHVGLVQHSVEKVAKLVHRVHAWLSHLLGTEVVAALEALGFKFEP